MVTHSSADDLGDCDDDSITSDVEVCAVEDAVPKQSKATIAWHFTAFKAGDTE